MGGDESIFWTFTGVPGRAFVFLGESSVCLEMEFQFLDMKKIEVKITEVERKLYVQSSIYFPLSSGKSMDALHSNQKAPPLIHILEG